MKAKAAIFRPPARLAAGALLTTLLAGGCITHPPGGKPQQVDSSKEARTPRHGKHDITHPPGGSNDVSKDGPRVTSPAPPAITHPGG